MWLWEPQWGGGGGAGSDRWGQGGAVDFVWTYLQPVILWKVFACVLFVVWVFEERRVLLGSGKKQPVQIQPVSEGLYEASYVPVNEGKCKLDVLYADKPVKNRSGHAEIRIIIYFFKF